MLLLLKKRIHLKKNWNITDQTHWHHLQKCLCITLRMNPQSQQTCPNPSVCVIFSCQGVSADVMDRSDVYQHTHTSLPNICVPPLRADQTSSTGMVKACHKTLWAEKTEPPSGSVWPRQTVTSPSHVPALPYPHTHRERAKNRHKRKRGKWPLYLSPDQNKTRWTTFQMLLVQQDLDTVSAGLLCVQAI